MLLGLRHTLSGSVCPGILVHDGLHGLIMVHKIHFVDTNMMHSALCSILSKLLQPLHCLCRTFCHNVWLARLCPSPFLRLHVSPCHCLDYVMDGMQVAVIWLRGTSSVAQTPHSCYNF